MTLPMWVANPDDPDGPPFRPTGALWVSVSSGLLHVALPEEGQTASPELALRALLEFGLKTTKLLVGRPSTVQVRDAIVQQALVDALARLNTTVTLVDELPAVREALRNLETMSSDEPIPGALAGTNVTVDLLRSFAEAAAAFYGAAPWRHLTNEDLVVVDSPLIPKSMRHVVVMGNGGQQFGVSFFPSRSGFNKIIEGKSVPRRAFGVTFGPIDELPFADVDAWTELGLPCAGSSAYPFGSDLRNDGSVRRLNAKELQASALLLRALAQTTEDELDSGSWSKTVHDGTTPITLGLTLPLLIEVESGNATPPHARFTAGRHAGEQSLARLTRFMEGKSLGSLEEVNAEIQRAQKAGLFDLPAEAAAGRPLTDLERAQELAYEAMGSMGRLRLKRARQALAISPDCADALMVLGDAVSTAREAVEWYEKAVAAAERAIGVDTLASVAGECWSRLETRPYMRARLALAESYESLGERDRALDHYRELLRLNPHDNQGVRYILLPALLEAGRDDEAGRLLEAYTDDAQAIWSYGLALHAFRAEGDSTRARTLLAEAMRRNRHVLGFWLDTEDRAPWPVEHYVLGSAEEGAYAAEALEPVLDATPGVMGWLAANARSSRRPGGRRSKRSRP